MAELADAHDSGSCVRTYLQVQVLFPARGAFDFQGLQNFYYYRITTVLLSDFWLFCIKIELTVKKFCYIIVNTIISVIVIVLNFLPDSLKKSVDYKGPVQFRQGQYKSREV